MKKAMVYIQSGGPTAVINTSLYGAIIEAKKHDDQIDKIYGSLYGVEGLIVDDLIDLGQEDEETIELLKQTPGAALGSTRYKLPKDLHDKQYLSIIETLKKHNIGYLFVNGGNDSMDTCHKISLLCKEIGYDCKVMGVPKTVDNDLALTDHSLGFASAAKHVVNTVKSICVDARVYKRGKVYIIEVMGRNAGWLTASVDLLPEETRPDLIYLPENHFSVENFLHDVKKLFDEKGNAIVVISEGIAFERDMSKARIDAFNHVQLGGVGDELAEMVEDRLDLPTRSIELSLPQRADPLLVSKVDQEEAIICGRLAVQLALKGHSGEMVCIKRVSDEPYLVEYVPEDIAKIANAERVVPQSMMAGPGHMDPSFRLYCLPLIQGSVDIKFENGMYKSATLKRIKVQ